MVYASSETVYGEQADYGDREIVEDDRLLPFPGSVYALSKCLAEVFAAQYDELYGIKSTALRPCIGYGHGGKDPVFVRWFSQHRVAAGHRQAGPPRVHRQLAVLDHPLRRGGRVHPRWPCTPTRRRTPPTTWADRR